MMEYLGGSSSKVATPAAVAAAAAPNTNTTSSLTSALQLARFYLGRGDLKAARELLFALQDGRLGPSTALQVPSVLLRPLFQQLVEAQFHAKDAMLAMEAATRMVQTGQRLTPALIVGLLKACGGTRIDLLATWWAQQQQQQQQQSIAWAENRAICLALLDVLGAAAVSSPPQAAATALQSLPSVQDVWEALCRHGPPPASAYASRITGLATAAKATAAPGATDGINLSDLLLSAVQDFAAQEEDANARRLVLKAAAEAMLQQQQQQQQQGGSVTGLQQVLQSLPLSSSTPAAVAAADVELYTHLLHLLSSSQLDALDVLWSHASQACKFYSSSSSSFFIPLGLILAYCRVALPSNSPTHINQALALLHDHFSSSGSSSSSIHPALDLDDVALVLESLCSQQRKVEVQKLQQSLLPALLPSPLPIPLSRALLKCAALEGKPGRAIACLHQLMGEDENGKEGGREGGRDVTQPTDYEAVLQALAGVELSTATMRERELVQNPLGFLSWVLEEGLMKKTQGSNAAAAAAAVAAAAASGGAPTPKAAHAALRILRRACEEEGKQGGLGGPREAFVQRAVALVSKLVAAGHETDDALCEDLVGVVVWGVSLHRAIEIIREMEQTHAAPAPLARAQALLITSLARRGDLGSAEEWFVRMNTLTGEGPSEGVLDAFALAYASEGNVPSGLSMLQGCFTQYGVRPSAGAFKKVFERCLGGREGGARDLFEAQRAVIIAQQLWAGEGEEMTEGGAFVQELEGRLAEAEAEAQAAAAAAAVVEATALTAEEK
jgi:hypothetical protein